MGERLSLVQLASSVAVVHNSKPIVLHSPNGSIEIAQANLPHPGS